MIHYRIRPHDIAGECGTCGEDRDTCDYGKCVECGMDRPLNDSGLCAECVRAPLEKEFMRPGSKEIKMENLGSASVDTVEANTRTGQATPHQENEWEKMNSIEKDYYIGIIPP